MAYVEQFIEVDAYTEKTPDQLLSQARMIKSMELGKDTLLRKDIRGLFRHEYAMVKHPSCRRIKGCSRSTNIIAITLVPTLIALPYILTTRGTREAYLAT